MASKEIPLIECDSYDCDNVEFGPDDLSELAEYCRENGWYVSTSQDLCPICASTV